MAVTGTSTLAPWTLALFAAVAFGCYTVIVERGMATATADSGESPVFAAAFFSTVIAVAAFWVLAFARGIPDGALTLPKVAPFVVAGVAYPALFRFTYYEGIDRVGASISAAIMGAYPAISALLAVLALNERVTLPGAAGIGLIVVGVALLQLQQQSGSTDLDDMLSERLAESDAADFLYPVSAMVLLGGSYVLIKFGLERFPDPVVATALTQTPALFVFGAWGLVSTEARGQLRIRWLVVGAFVAAGAFNVMGWLGQFFALQAGTVITVIPLLNTFPLVVMAISYGIARQVPRSPRIVAAVLAIVAGATLVQALG